MSSNLPQAPSLLTPPWQQLQRRELQFLSMTRMQILNGIETALSQNALSFI
jgi:hypothetical protein